MIAARCLPGRKRPPTPTVTTKASNSSPACYARARRRLVRNSPESASDLPARSIPCVASLVTLIFSPAGAARVRSRVLRGCWESLAAGPAMVAWLERHAPEVYPHRAGITAKKICELAQRGDEVALQ